MQLIKKLLFFGSLSYLFTYLIKRQMRNKHNVPVITQDDLLDINYMNELVYINTDEYSVIYHKKDDKCALCDKYGDKHNIKIKDRSYAHSMFTIGENKNHTFTQANIDAKDKS